MTPSLPTIHIPHSWPSLMAHDFTGAKSRIWLTALSAQPCDPHARTPASTWWMALVSAATRGVSVRLQLAAPSSSHPATTANAGAARWCARRGISATLVPGPRLLHAKSAIIDDRIAWIGSGNFTAAAMSSNHELYARVASADFAARLANEHDRIAGVLDAAPYSDLPERNENHRP